VKYRVQNIFILTVLVITVPLSPAAFPSSNKQTATSSIDSVLSQQVIPVDLVQSPSEHRSALFDFFQTWTPILALIGVVITALITLRRGRMDARYGYAAEILKYRLRQLEEFYSPALLLVEQSRKVYEKLTWAIGRERPEFSVETFRLLDHISELRNSTTLEPLVQQILDIGERLTKLISKNSGLIEGQITQTFIDYQAHYAILSAAKDQELTEEQKEGWHQLGYYPRLLNRELREGYKLVLAHIEKYAYAADETIGDILGQKAIDVGRFRRELITNLRYYEDHVRPYAARFDGFDMSFARNRFLKELISGTSRSQEPYASRKVLDAGCGTGRDAYAFVNEGYEVLAVDASPAMLRECNRKLHKALKEAVDEQKRSAASNSATAEMTFDELNFEDQFDGVWAAASLLHVPPEEMQAIISKLIASLRQNGVAYMSFKHGRGVRTFDGRFYSYWSRRRIRQLLKRAPGAQEIAIWLTDLKGKEIVGTALRDVWWSEVFHRYDQDCWLNVLVKKTRG
jgi:SAM-dependent methyltransferase